MPDDEKLMQQALEALVGLNGVRMTFGQSTAVSIAAEDLRERLAQPECCCQEPDAPGVVHRTDGPCYMQAQRAQELVYLVEDDFGLFRVTDKADYAYWSDTGRRKTLVANTAPQPDELAATQRQVEILTDELAKCEKALKAAQQPVQEPVAWTPQVWRQFRPDGTLEFQKIKRTPNGEWEDYTAPQPRQWQGLTEEERDEIEEIAPSVGDAISMAQWKLREKNRGAA